MKNEFLSKLNNEKGDFPPTFLSAAEDPMFSLGKMQFCTCTFVNLGMNCNFGPPVHGLHKGMLKAFLEV